MLHTWWCQGSNDELYIRTISNIIRVERRLELVEQPFVAVALGPEERVETLSAQRARRVARPGRHLRVHTVD